MFHLLGLVVILNLGNGRKFGSMCCLESVRIVRRVGSDERAGNMQDLILKVLVESRILIHLGYIMCLCLGVMSHRKTLNPDIQFFPL